MKFLLPFIFVFIFPFSSFGAVAVDGTATQFSISGSDTLSVSKSTSGSNRFLTVGIMTQPYSVTGVTFNSIGLTQKSALADFGGTNDIWLYEKALEGAVTTGSFSVVITTTDVANNIAAGAISFTGVDQSTPTGTAATSTDFYNTPVSITVPANGIALGIVADSNCDTINPTDEQTKQWDVCADSGLFVKSAGATTTTTGTLPWNEPTGYNAQIGVAINPAAAAAVAARRRIIIIQ